MKRIVCVLIGLGGCSGEFVSRSTAHGDPENLVEYFGALIEGAQVSPREGGAGITPPDEETVTILQSLRRKGVEKHLPYLVEYGLKFHRACLDHSHLARELPVEENELFSELLRIAKIPKYRTPHEAGWLSHQFHGPFERTGWSSFQVYLFAKERRVFDTWPNGERILALLTQIDGSPASRIGGDNVCHYGCR